MKVHTLEVVVKIDDEDSSAPSLDEVMSDIQQIQWQHHPAVTIGIVREKK